VQQYFIFPGVGLGALISEASYISDSMFLVAAQALAEFTCSQKNWDGALYPSLAHLRAVSKRIGLRVAQTARAEGWGRTMDDDALKTGIEDFVWVPSYSGNSQPFQRGGGI
jgi:malic enzyme